MRSIKAKYSDLACPYKISGTCINYSYHLLPNRRLKKGPRFQGPASSFMVRWMRIELTPCYRLAPETSASTVPPPAHGDKYTINPPKSRISLARLFHHRPLSENNRLQKTGRDRGYESDGRRRDPRSIFAHLQSNRVDVRV